MADPLDTSDRAQLSAREVADQHEPNARPGRDGTLAALDAHMKRSPAMSHDIKRVIHGEDGTVAVHYHFKHAPDQRGLAVVDLFRIEDGYLVEHWDIIQPIPDPATAKNSNGMF